MIIWHLNKRDQQRYKISVPKKNAIHNLFDIEIFKISDKDFSCKYETV